MRLFYRPEIDGLRAIAVVAVILYHSRITILDHQPFIGGFIGVDIFFVISGYLITSIILKELISTGNFSFKYFYERRIRRILPALLIVMLFSLPFAWLFLLPVSFIDFSKSILYSLGFSSNYYFYFSGQEYGSENGLLKPFLHTWSLSVEEQYYILFPIVILISFKYFQKNLFYILIFLFVISLAFADWSSSNYPLLNFYSLHSRVWELSAGSILAYQEITLGHRSKNKTFNLVLPSVGLILILYSILFFNDEMFHPSLYSIIPIIGVCLIIWFSSENEIITKILSSKLFVGIGLISYSLYLWHYPIFAFARITDYTQQNAIVKNLLLGIIILILSIASYYFIERPFRNKKNNFKILLSVIIIFILILLTFNYKVVLNKGYRDRLPEILKSNFSGILWKGLKNSNGEICFSNLQGCKFNTSANKKVYIIGDSHAGSLMLDLKDKVVEKKYQFITLVSSGCLYFPGFNLVDKKTGKVNEICNQEYFNKIKKILSKETNSIFIFSGRFPLYISNIYFDNQEDGVEGKEWYENYVSVGKYESLQSSFRNEVLELSKNNKIILVYPIPEVGWSPRRKILSQYINRKNKFSKNFELTYITTSFDVLKNRNELSFELLDSIRGDNIYRVYPQNLFCDTTIKDRCVTHDKENVFYTDAHHPSYKGAEMINDLIMKEVEKIELKPN